MKYLLLLSLISCSPKIVYIQPKGIIAGDCVILRDTENGESPLFFKILTIKGQEHSGVMATEFVKTKAISIPKSFYKYNFSVTCPKILKSS